MTVLATEPNKVVALGNGVATVFSFSPMVIYSAADLVVTFVNAAGAETPLQEGLGQTHYVLNIAAFPGTGSITFPADPLGAKLQTGEKLIILPVLLFEQTVDLQNQGGYFPDVQETMHDKVVKLTKQLLEIADRSLKLPPTEAGGATTILPPASQRANKILGFGADGNQIITSSNISGTLVTSFGATIVDDSSSAETRITLDAAKRNWIVDNLSISAVNDGGNNLIIEIRNQLNQAPTAQNPLVFVFADTSLGTQGSFSRVTQTSALTLTVSAGSSLGTQNGVASRVYIGIANDGGTARVFVYQATSPVDGSFIGLEEDKTYSSTAEGGAGAADAAQTLYSGTAFTSRHIRVLGYVESTQAIAGTWATNPVKTILMSNPAIDTVPPTVGQQSSAGSSSDNPIINGNMEVWQRGPTFVAVPTATFTADRFGWDAVGVGVVTINRSTNVPTVEEAGVLFNFSLEVDVTTADAAISASDLYRIVHRIEGFNWRHFAQRQFTLSFWVRSPKVGIHCVSFRNSGSDRFYIAEYTVNQANTWERKSVTIAPSPSAGTWNYTEGTGLQIAFVLADGTTAGTPGSWQTGSAFATANQVNCMDNTANFFRLTGVKMELGSLVTPIQFRSFQDELNLCKRYYQKSFRYGVTPIQNAGVGSGSTFVPAPMTGAVTRQFQVHLPVAMRTHLLTNVVLFSPAENSAQVWNTTDSAALTATTSFAGNESNFEIQATGTAGTTVGERLEIHWTVAAEL